MNDAIETAMADVVEGLERLSAGVEALTKRDGFNADGLESALADVVEQIKALAERKPADLGPLVQAIKGIRITPPEVKVNVQPTPIQVQVDAPTVNLEATLQTPQWEALSVAFIRNGVNGPIERMTISKVK